MTTIANTAVALVAILHFGFLVLEMFLWTRPLGLRTFGTTPDFARASKALAANQGLYNGFVATGLGWGLVLGDAGTSIKIFFSAASSSPAYSAALRRAARSSGPRRFPAPWRSCS